MAYMQEVFETGISCRPKSVHLLLKSYVAFTVLAETPRLRVSCAQ